MKELLEGREVSAKTQLHLDRCLTCRACETTCPSGVQYGRLVDIGRNVVERRVGRPMLDALKRKALRTVIPNPKLFNALLKLGQLARPLLPAALAHKVPKPRLQGCVQPGIAPGINPALARVLDRIGVSLIAAERVDCCGAVSYHLNAQDEGLDTMRENIDAWWPHVEQGVEAIVMTASGCGVMVKEYGHLLAHDPRYAQKAKRISALTKDATEVLAAERSALVSRLAPPTAPERIAFHSPCTLQHGMQIRGVAESLLAAAGYALTPVPDAHLCCGSAGTYSILQPALSKKLLANKVEALQSGAPRLIATANIGCLAHIQSGTALRVRHWVELIDERMTA
jgi:glycolate oxidase iron-sulfur subunit